MDTGDDGRVEGRDQPAGEMTAQNRSRSISTFAGMLGLRKTIHIIWIDLL